LYLNEESESAREISRFNRDPSPEVRDTLTTPLTAYGDNEEITEESNEIFDYDKDVDIDSKIYGY
jgi:hypothetical protein